MTSNSIEVSLFLKWVHDGQEELLKGARHCMREDESRCPTELIKNMECLYNEIQ